MADEGLNCSVRSDRKQLLCGVGVLRCGRVTSRRRRCRRRCGVARCSSRRRRCRRRRCRLCSRCRAVRHWGCLFLFLAGGDADAESEECSEEVLRHLHEVLKE